MSSARDLLDRGMLPVSDGNTIYWETSGTPNGTPVLYLHGGPGSGAGSSYLRGVDPLTHHIVGFDQRGCGRSRPLLTDPGTIPDTHTTGAMIADIEALRSHLGVESWLVTGMSWGTTLALAYAQAHPGRVSALVLTAVTTTSTREVEWVTEDMGRIFPREWDAFVSAVPRRPGERILDAYARALWDADPAVRAATARAWCDWEDVHVSLATGWKPSERYLDPAFRELFATTVTHHWARSGFGGDDILGRMGLIGDIPECSFTAGWTSAALSTRR